MYRYVIHIIFIQNLLLSYCFSIKTFIIMSYCPTIFKWEYLIFKKLYRLINLSIDVIHHYYGNKQFVFE